MRPYGPLYKLCKFYANETSSFRESAQYRFYKVKFVMLKFKNKSA